MGFAICMIYCWDCGHVIDDYDPALDQYTCAKCREKAHKRNVKRDRMRPRKPITEETDLAEFDF